MRMKRRTDAQIREDAENALKAYAGSSSGGGSPTGERSEAASEVPTASQSGAKAPASKPRTVTLTFAEDGSIQHTLREDLPQELFPQGDRHIERMSEILHDGDRQKFYIRFLRGCRQEEAGMKVFIIGAEVTNELIRVLALDDCTKLLPTLFRAKQSWTHDDAAFFDTYAEAVAAEVIVIDKLRTMGFVF